MESANITCKNCGNTFTGKYCNNCGEKVYQEEYKSTLHLLEEGLHFTTHLDGTLFTTLKAVFTSPGKLSQDYCNGLHKKYFKPLSFFLLLVILYLLFPLFEGLNMRLYFHEQHSLYGRYATHKVAAIMEKRHINESQLAESFHHISEKISKFLLFVIIPMMALISRILGFRKRKYYFDHFVFATEICSFFILWGFLLLPFLNMMFYSIVGSNLFASDFASGMMIMAVFGIYVAVAARRFFHFKYWYSILYALLISVALIASIEYIYKFILFLITIQFA